MIECETDETKKKQHVSSPSILLTKIPLLFGCLNSALHSQYSLQFLLLINQIQNLIKFCSKKIQASQDCTVWTQAILPHNLFIVNGITNINVTRKRSVSDGRV